MDEDRNMNLSLPWINGVSEVWWQYVLQIGGQAALVGGGLVLAVRWAGDRWPAPLRYALLVLALLKFACPPLLPVAMPHLPPLPFTLFRSAVERKSALAPEPGAIAASVADGPGRDATGLRTPQGIFSRPLAFARGVSWTTWLMLIHAGGAAIVITSVRRQSCRLRELERTGQRRLQPPLVEEYRDLAIDFGVYQIPALSISERAEAPMAFGFSRPSIILPLSVATSLSRVELKAVLAHELAHCRRGDLWLIWLQVLIFAFWWFHPVLWMVNRHLNEAREDCCDDLVLERGVISHDSYCDLLLRAATAAIHPGTALAFRPKVHPLGRRITRITDWTLQRCEQVSRANVVAVVATAALLLPGLAITPRPVQALPNRVPDRALVPAVVAIQVRSNTPTARTVPAGHARGLESRLPPSTAPRANARAPVPRSPAMGDANARGLGPRTQSATTAGTYATRPGLRMPPTPGLLTGPPVGYVRSVNIGGGQRIYPVLVRPAPVFIPRTGPAPGAAPLFISRRSIYFSPATMSGVLRRSSS